MITEVKPISGAVYQTILSEDPVRIIKCDEIEVYYDAYWPSLDKWTFASNLKRSATYYRTAPKVFLRDAILLRQQPLSAEEFKTFRPDLPNRLCRNKFMTWTDQSFKDLREFKQYAAQFEIDTSDKIVLNVPSISISPFGAEGRVSALKPTTIESVSPNGFTTIELLWLANKVQAEHAKHIVEKGIGIYRSGHHKKLPSYYIWTYYDKAGIIPVEE